MTKAFLTLLLLGPLAATAQSIKTTVNPQTDPQTVSITLEYVPAAGYTPKQFFWDTGDCPKAQRDANVPCSYLGSNPKTHEYKPGDYVILVITDDGKGNQTNAKKHIKVSLPLTEAPLE